ncbi:hypothetical protein P5W99_35875 [Paraburkholderia sp. A3BS-1L]
MIRALLGHWAADKNKHLGNGGNRTSNGFAPEALHPPLTSTLLSLA